MAKLLLPSAALAQGAGPLHKSELVRLLAVRPESEEELAALVREHCLAFTPTDRDRADLIKLRAGEGVLQAIRSCEGRVRSPSRLRPATPAAAGGAELLEAPPELLDGTPASEIMAVGLPVPQFTSGTPPLAGLPSRSTVEQIAPMRIDRPPRLTNPAEVARLLKQHYPPDLLRQGIGGKVVLRLLIDVDGRVAQTEVAESSSIARLDEAAVQVAANMRFTPARARNLEVRTWTRQPVIFTAQ